MSKTLFISDPHFFHEKLAKIRGFDSAEDMNRFIISNINATCEPDDTLWFLGDISFGKSGPTVELLKQIRCKICLVPGNHDKKMSDAVRALFEEIDKIKELHVNVEGERYTFILCHFPILSWEKKHYRSIHLHGHCHGGLRLPAELQGNRILDVGCEPVNFTPISAEEIVKGFQNAIFTPIDLHTEKTGAAPQE